MPSVLVLFAHPALERSRIQRALIHRHEHWPPEITFHDLYELYPDFVIDVGLEQDLLLRHEIIVWQHPLYWYSVPPLLKQWIDLTLEHGWAYGSRGVYLRGKTALNVITAGGRADAYCASGHNRYTLQQFLYPLERTAALCGIDFREPYVIYGTHELHGAAIDREAERYRAFLFGLATGDGLPAPVVTEESSPPPPPPPPLPPDAVAL